MDNSFLLAGPAPDQAYGSADGRSHTAASADTRAAAKGGRRGHEAAAGELGAASTVPTDTDPLADAAKVDLTAPEAQETEAPAEPYQAEGYDPDTSRELPGERGRQQRTYRNENGTRTTRF